MFYRSNTSHFSLILLAIIIVSKADDYLLNFGSNSEIMYKPVYSGNGLAFCSWMKLRDPYIEFFDAITEKDGQTTAFSILSFDSKIIYASGNIDTSKLGYTTSSNGLPTKYTTWFHVCVVRNESFIMFYINGKPIEKYTQQAKLSQLTKNVDIQIWIGSFGKYYQNGSIFQANVFDRSITAEEANDLYNCEKVEGDLLPWRKIISKSDGISFLNNIFLVKGDVPCPTSSFPGYGMSNSGDPGSSSGDSNSGSPSEEPGSSSGSS